MHASADYVAYWQRQLAAVGSLDLEIPVDLVDMNCCRSDLASVIESEGIPL